MFYRKNQNHQIRIKTKEIHVKIISMTTFFYSNHIPLIFFFFLINFRLLPCANFHHNFTVPLHINGIKVQCKSKHFNSILQEDAYTFIQVNKTTLQSDISQKETIDKVRKPSILMIGIDSLSRINFRRNMPQMLKYLKDHKWYELLGYNKVRYYGIRSSRILQVCLSVKIIFIKVNIGL